ncbi:protein FAM136A-like isoform X2 [Camponotus floridanus]|uniref:protein FAM136A-like isoform X2 n=1 Tax=Camponotus floridanus TaxID=104421 RepID=UPI000DC6C2E3|nr:protein FAM136A-like isoform X2 [Camponotus floridanus]
MEEQKKRVEDNMTKIVEEIDKTYLRKMQRDMHKCAAQCCENETYSIQKVHNCVENCSSSLNKAQQYVQGEFERVQFIQLVAILISYFNDEVMTFAKSVFVLSILMTRIVCKDV